MAKSSRVFFLLSLAGVPNGYMAVGYLLFLQEQMKGIIILLELRQGGLHQILELLSFLQARHFVRVSPFSSFGIAEKETVASARFHGGHPVNHFKGVCAGSAGGPAGHFEAR